MKHEWPLQRAAMQHRKGMANGSKGPFLSVLSRCRKGENRTGALRKNAPIQFVRQSVCIADSYFFLAAMVDRALIHTACAAAPEHSAR